MHATSLRPAAAHLAAGVADRRARPGARPGVARAHRGAGARGRPHADLARRCSSSTASATSRRTRAASTSTRSGVERRRPRRDPARRSTGTTPSSPARSRTPARRADPLRGLVRLRDARDQPRRRRAADRRVGRRRDPDRPHRDRGQWFARLVTHDRRARPVLWQALPPSADRELRPAGTRVGRHAGAPRSRSARCAPRSTRVERRRARRSTSAPGRGARRAPAAARWPEAEVVGVDVSSRDDQRGPARSRRRARSATRSPTPRALPLRGRRVRPRDDEQHDPVLRRGRPGHRARRTGRHLLQPRLIDAHLGAARAHSGRLERRNFSHVAIFSSGPGLSLLARKDDRS